jgi:arylsulfatase A-like enzyme
MRARRPEIASLFALACALAACSPERSAAPAPAPAPAPGPAVARDLILISIDTLRADRLGAYGHARPTSPRLDGLAARGVLFEDVSSTAPWTLPAHLSLLTGLYPSGHGVRTPRHRLHDDVPTLASVLAANGFACGAFVNSFFMGDRFGYARGFQPYRNLVEAQERSGQTPKIVRDATRWLRSQRHRRRFLFVHLFDVHSDYKSNHTYEEMFTTPGASQFDGNTIVISMGIRGDIEIKPSDVEHLSGLYDAGIRQLDDQLEPLFRFLERRKSLEDTLLVITADHGEEFRDHGGLMHGGTHYQELLHVPLILVGPTLPAGVRIAAPVSLVDVMPTVLDLLGIPAPAEMDGRSLRPLWEGGDAEDGRPLLAETGPADIDALRTLRRGHLKLIDDARTGRQQLFDLAADPGETRDLAAEREDEVHELSEQLDELARPRREPTLLPEPTPEMLEHLRALGYVE